LRSWVPNTVQFISLEMTACRWFTASCRNCTTPSRTEVGRGTDLRLGWAKFAAEFPVLVPFVEVSSPDARHEACSPVADTIQGPERCRMKTPTESVETRQAMQLRKRVLASFRPRVWWVTVSANWDAR